MRIQKKGGLGAWQARYLSAVVLSVASVAVLFGPGIASGASAPEASDKLGNFDQAIADLRQEAGQDRRDIVKANMLLTASEGNTFWPLYDEYRNERSALNDKKVNLVKDFLSKRDTMTQDEAEKLTKEFFELQKDTVSLKEKYWSRMNKQLSARTTSRFFQIDQKLDAAVDLVIASRVPLIH
jgi:polyhydroxyalkanoate synthesis regulator phasin